MQKTTCYTDSLLGNLGQNVHEITIFKLFSVFDFFKNLPDDSNIIFAPLDAFLFRKRISSKKAVCWQSISRKVNKK